jgi:hypothetical protein
MSTSLLSLMLASQAGAARLEAWRGRRFIFVLLSILLILAIVYMVKRVMSK